MKHFAISPLGMTADDLNAISDGLEARARQGADFVMHYWSKERRILLVIQHEAGQVLDWLMLPCGSLDEAPALLAWWLEQAAEDVREREEAAQSSAAAEVDRVRAGRH